MINMYEILDSITWYNGIYEPLLEIKKRVEDFTIINELGGCNMCRPCDEDYFEDEQFEIFWMMLVLLFGDYGTSPRYGWLEIDKNRNEIINFIDKITKIGQEDNNSTNDYV